MSNAVCRETELLAELKNVKTVEQFAAWFQSLKPSHWLCKKVGTRNSGKSKATVVYAANGLIEYLWDDGATSGKCLPKNASRVFDLVAVDEFFYETHQGYDVEFKILN